jgi:aquaporin Z
MVCIYTFGGVSGANFNPAVSVTLGLIKTLGGKDIGMGWDDVGVYSIVQLIAGAVAGVGYKLLFGKAFHLHPAHGFGLRSAGPCEMWYTFVLCFVVLNVAVAKKTTPNHYYGLAIGFVIVAGAFGAGAVSGGCFNPAVAFGIAAASMEGPSFQWFFFYTVYQIIGSTIAAVLFKHVRSDEFGEGGEVTPRPSASTKYICEMVGTFVLVLTVGLNVLGKSPAGAFSIAASLMCMIYALGDISGAHFNPAVTLAIYCSKWNTMSGGEAAQYMLSQIVGALLASYTYAYIHYWQTFPLGPGKGYTWTQVAIAEFMFTFVLCLIVLCVAVSEKTKAPNMFGLAIGSCVTVGGCAIGSISGGALNPAVAAGIAGSEIINGGFFFKAFFYAFFEFLGAAAAAGVVSQTHVEEKVGA